MKKIAESLALLVVIRNPIQITYSKVNQSSDICTAALSANKKIKASGAISTTHSTF